VDLTEKVRELVIIAKEQGHLTSDDIDDAFCLSLLLRCPEIDLKSISTVLNDTAGRADMCRELAEAAGKNPTRQSILDAIQKNGFTGPGIVPLGFSASSHTGYTGVQIAKITGKTTTLKYVHAASKPENRGNLVLLATDTDRTLYFDYLPVRLLKLGASAAA